jgi:hypothetical protein
MRKILFISSLLTFLFTSSIWAANISGTWVLKYTGNQGDERSYDMVIKAAGEDLTVTATHPSLGEMAGTGTLKGSDIAMTLTATGERKIGFVLTGTVTGDKMAGTREVNAPERDASEASQSGGRGDSSGGGREGAEMGARGDASGSDQAGAQRGPRGDSSSGDQGGSQRPSRSDSAASASSGAPGGAPSGAPGSDTSKAKEVSKDWTAEKK